MQYRANGQVIMKLYDTVACEALLRTGTLYDIATVDFLSELKPV